MATGNFDGEIQDAMQSKSRMKPGGVPAKRSATPSSPMRPTPPKSVSKPPPAFPPKQQPAIPAQQPVPQQMPMPMPGMQPDPMGHAAGIAHAILAHGKGGMM